MSGKSNDSLVSTGRMYIAVKSFNKEISIFNFVVTPNVTVNILNFVLSFQMYFYPQTFRKKNHLFFQIYLVTKRFIIFCLHQSK